MSEDTLVTVSYKAAAATIAIAGGLYLYFYVGTFRVRSGFGDFHRHRMFISCATIF